MRITAAEFRARCLGLIDQVRERGESIVITKRGRIVATLEPAGDFNAQPWRQLHETARWNGDPTAPVVKESEIGLIQKSGLSVSSVPSRATASQVSARAR